MEFFTKDPQNLEEAMKALVRIAGLIQRARYQEEEPDFSLLQDEKAIQVFNKMKRTLEAADDRLDELTKRVEQDPVRIEEKKKEKILQWRKFLEEAKTDPELVQKIMDSVTVWQG